MSPSAVLFDLDGTLVNSAPLWRAALAAVVAEWRSDVSDEVFDGLAGMTALDAVMRVRDRLQILEGDPAEVVRKVEDGVRIRCHTQGVWLPGAYALVSDARAAGLAVGLVTSSSRRVVDAVLRTADSPEFDVVVCGDDVCRVKPDPEPYRRAAASLFRRTADCVAVEDSDAGVRSAQAAGCAVLAIVDDPSGAHSTGCLPVSDLTEINVNLLLGITNSAHDRTGS